MFASPNIGLPSSSLSSISSQIWILDSRAFYHMSSHYKYFVSLLLSSFVSIMTTDGTFMPLVGIGSISTFQLSISNVYYIPNLTLSLVSTSQLCDSHYSILFYLTSCL